VVGFFRLEFEDVDHFLFYRSDERHMGTFCATRNALALAHFDAQKVGKN
jgi:hypothetical protein